MKYKVIGWTEYDDYTIETEDCSYAAYNAIIDDIKAHGYCFSGYSHQETLCGAPVLNDGKKRLFSQRGFGRLMAEAHGHYGYMDYTSYAFSFDNFEDEKTPSFDRSLFGEEVASEENLNEEYRLNVSQKIYDKAKSEHKYLDVAHASLRYLDVGDTLTLISNGESCSYKVLDLEYGWNKAKAKNEIIPIFIDEINNLIYCGSLGEKERLNELYRSGQKIISVDVQPI